ncbi:hypothetical protein BVI1335_1940011 [Burkholderia vietnamiensis]|nr:hypothetical protein BVI1335_1940011 [Burkholderia vietnamiensis]
MCLLYRPAASCVPAVTKWGTVAGALAESRADTRIGNACAGIRRGSRRRRRRGVITTGEPNAFGWRGADKIEHVKPSSSQSSDN